MESSSGVGTVQWWARVEREERAVKAEKRERRKRQRPEWFMMVSFLCCVNSGLRRGLLNCLVKSFIRVEVFYCFLRTAFRCSSAAMTPASFWTSEYLSAGRVTSRTV